MSIRKYIQALGFLPKENTSDIFIKKYADNHLIEIDFGKELINYGEKIKAESKTSSNFSQPENFVVLECVDRILEKGYKPENIILEKTWAAGHGTSGRLDICVTRDDGSEYLLIECKTSGKEFDKAFSRMNKDGGQLFTYFKFSNKADLIMLYASELKSNKIVYRNEIVKIEEDYRTGDVKDFYEKWNKLTKDNGVFDAWVKPYNFESKALTITDLVEIKQEDSSFIFNRFLEILRHNVVSDKGNAFNRIFTLFLCKIYDEKVNEGTDNELGFQWLEGIDDHRSFQLRLTDLYKNGMHEFLEKVVTDFSETEFKNKFPFLSEQQRQPILEEIRKIRLEKNNEFAIKDVYDEQSFNENAVVVKEIVELLQNYKLRYTKKQQYLSDFFELLLTTGLKQESGQFFTPVPVAQFIIKSLPIDAIVEEKLSSAKIENDTLLPYVIDYAAGSGHFVTETMHEIQRLIDQKDDKKYHPSVAKKIRNWKDDHFVWAIQYIYGIEKDYRLVKVGKVGCYLHGDGLANVIHSDGLARFGHPDYKGKLLYKDKDFPQDNKQFDMLVSNPPYSVSAFKNSARAFYKDESFELYNSLTDNSSEIETLFVERTKQLLKDGGVAGIILPSSILSNTGIYTKAREIILQNFEIIGITELGSNTFMATGTNTVVLFLRRRNNYDSINLRKAVEKFVTDYNDVTLNGIEKPATKYVKYVWEGIALDDYISLLKKEPNSAIIQHEIYKEYHKKLKARNEADFWKQLLEREAEKLFYFILAYPQKVVLIKSGQKDDEKRFLGYEFSNRRGSEGIHPIQRGKSIAECTKMFDEDSFENPEKASTYIYRAFKGDFESEIHPSQQQNITRHSLVDMLTFDRVEFEKSISTAVKKKVRVDSKWEQVLFTNAIEKINGNTIKIEKYKILESGKYPVITQEREKFISGYSNETNPVTDLPIVLFGDHSCTLKYLDFNFFRGADGTVLLKPTKDFNPKYFYNVLLYSVFELIENKDKYERHYKYLQNVFIPLPSLDIQQKIVAEIEVFEQKEEKAKKEIEGLKNSVVDLIKSDKTIELRSLLSEINPEKSTTINSLEDNSVVSFLSMPDVSNEGQITNLQKRELKDVKTGYTFFQENDVLFAKITPCMENGKGALVSKLENNIGFGSTEFFVLRPDEKKLLPKILFYFTQSKDFRINAEKQMTGASGHRRVPKSFVENYQVPFIPLSEQQKIVAEIEQIETQIAALEAEIAEIPKQKEAVLKKYL
jgi:type I restriction enzyme M protein